MLVSISYKDDYSQQRGNGGRGNGIKAEKEQAPIPSSGKYCSICHEIVGNGDPDREDIYDSNGKEIGRKHNSCARRLAVARGKNTELREAANL